MKINISAVTYTKKSFNKRTVIFRSLTAIYKNDDVHVNVNCDFGTFGKLSNRGL